MIHLKLLEKQEQTKPQNSKWTEIIKIKAELYDIKIKQTIQKLNETKNRFFEKISKIDKLLANITKQRREKTQIHKIGDEKGDIPTNTNKIQRLL
jgi:hypothetical protein